MCNRVWRHLVHTSVALEIVYDKNCFFFCHEMTLFHLVIREKSQFHCWVPHTWNVQKCEYHLCMPQGSIFDPYPFLIFIKGMLLSKALLCMNFHCINKNGYFIIETSTFGYIAVWTIYTSDTDHFTPQQTIFEHLAAWLSVVFELLPGFIPFTILWQAGWVLE